MEIISQSKFTGYNSSFKSRKTNQIGPGLSLDVRRKQDLEAKAINDKQNQEQAKAKEISRGEKERKTMRADLEKRVSSEEADPNRNTDARRKVVNVGRPDTAKSPMDPRSKLAKQGEIQRKIIEDQEKNSMTFQKYHSLPDDLVNAVRLVMEKKNPFVKDNDKTSAKKDDDVDDSDDKNMKSKKSENGDDVDDSENSEKMVGKNGKTKVDIAPKLKVSNEELKGGQKKLDKNNNGKLDKHDFKMLRKEEVEQVDEASSFYVRSVKGSHGDDKVHGKHNDLKSALASAQKIKGGHVVRTSGPKKNSSYETITHYYNPDGVVSKPGSKEDNRFHPKHGTNRMDLDENITPNQEVEQVDELSNKTLRNYTGAATKEDITLSDEETARILAKLNEADDDEDKHDGPEHIVMQLRKAKSLGAANRPIHFHDGSKVNVSSGHVRKALDMHNSFKKTLDKEEFTKKLQASHSSFKKAIGER